MKPNLDFCNQLQTELWEAGLVSNRACSKASTEQVRRWGWDGDTRPKPKKEKGQPKLEERGSVAVQSGTFSDLPQQEGGFTGLYGRQRWRLKK